MQTKTETDKCACCGCDTGIPKNTPLNTRKHYVQGCGQLCDKCYIELYVHKSEDETLVSLNEMNELIRLSRE